MRIVISLGGSLLYTEEGLFDNDYLAKFCSVIKKAHLKKIELVIITGGGKKARLYAQKAREELGSEFFADRAAIKATKENAQELINELGTIAGKTILSDFDLAYKLIQEGKIGVGGGMLEGLTTDAISVLFAERLNADFVINLGDTDGIYTADPKTDKNAKLLKKMSHKELVLMAVVKDQRKAGTHFVFDLVASKLAARSGIELRFANGRNLPQVEAAIYGKGFAGTVVSD